MTIELYFSNRLEDLAEKFSAVMARENREKKNILEGSLTIVPNQNLAKWLQLTLAKQQSVLMNVDFQYLDEGLWNLIAGLDEREEKPVRLDHPFRQMLLLYALQEYGRKIFRPYEPLNRYLLGPDGRQGPDYGIKLWQLTERMVHLFEEYEFHRSDMIRSWLSGYRPINEMERCQQKLYLRMLALRDGYGREVGQRILSLGEYAGEILPASVELSSESSPDGNHRKFVHIFGLSQVSPFHLDVIGRLQWKHLICMYVLNPSREFWEDIKTPGEKRWIQRKKVKRLAITPFEEEQGELLEPENNQLLALWGKAGRENIRLLCELTNYDFHACFTEERSSDSVLQQLQKNILTLSTERKDQDRRLQDRSLQIFACPGIYREVETVYNNILYNLEQDPTLQLTDIAILVSDISRYKPVIDSFFNSGIGNLSYNLVDSRADTDSVYAKGILLLLELASGRFSRKEIFDLMANPCFMQRWRIHETDIGAWATWVNDLNIFHSFDADEKKKRGYSDTDYHTWKQGLQRLRLSRILSAPVAGTEKGSPHFHGLVPFSDAHTGDTDLLEKFSLVIEKLHRAAIQLTGLLGSGETWSALFLHLCDELLQVPLDFKGEAAVQQALIKALLELKIYDQLAMEKDRKEKVQLNFEVMREFIKSSLGAISGGRGDYLTEGVTISALQPMRPIPFRVVYVLGMEEGAFPGKADASSLDLRLQKRRIGDVSVPERNCYLFLEMLLSIREKLYIGYLSKDLQKDRAIQPCSVINQLRRVVEKEILPDNTGFRVAEIPLKGSSEKYLSKDAVNGFSDVLVNYSMADRISCYREQGLWEEVRRKLSQEEAKRLERFSPDFGVKRQRREKEGKIVEKISVKELKKFLEDPASRGMKRHLRIYDEEETTEDISLREDEPFFSVFPVDYNIKTQALGQWLDQRVSPENKEPLPERMLEILCCRVYEDFQRCSETPEGAYADLDQEAMTEEVVGRGQVLTPVVAEMLLFKKDLYRAFFVGEEGEVSISRDNPLPIERLRAAGLTVQTSDSFGESVETDVALHGRLPWVWKEGEGIWHALIVTGSGKTPKPKEPDKYVLEPLLSWMACLQTEEGKEMLTDSSGNTTILFHVAYKDRVCKRTYHLNIDDARSYLKSLISAFLDQEKLEWLPFEEATSQQIKPHKDLIYEPDSTREILFREQLMDAYEKEDSFLIQLAAPQIPQDAYEKARDRFRIFFAFEEAGL